MSLFSSASFQPTPENQKKLYRLLVEWGASVTGLLIDRVATALALMLFARKILPIEYGQYLSTFNLVTFLAVLPGLGLDTWILARGKFEPGELIKLWSSMIRSRLRAFLLWGAGMLLLSVFLSKDTYPTGLLAIILVGVAFDSLNLLSIASLRILNRQFSVAALLGLSSISILIIAWWLPASTETLLQFAIARAIISMLVFILGLLMVDWRTLLRWRDPYPMKDVIRSARTFLWADISSVIYIRADVNIIGLMVGSIGNSVYGPAINILQMTYLIPRAIFYYVVPKLAAAFQHSPKPAFTRLSTLQLLAQGLFGVPSSAILYFLGPALVQLAFGDAYLESASVLKVFSILPTVRALNFALGAILMTSQKQEPRTRVQIVAAGFNVLANILVINRYGILAVAWVYVASELILLLGYAGILLLKRR